MKRKKIRIKPLDDLTDLRSDGPIHSDVLGSYTGQPEDDDRPQQDADDL